MKLLTEVQKQLLETASQYCSEKNPIKYDILKSLCNCKSFDSTFNLLLKQGYFAHHQTADYSNQFKRTGKQYTK